MSAFKNAYFYLENNVVHNLAKNWRMLLDQNTWVDVNEHDAEMCDYIKNQKLNQYLNKKPITHISGYFRPKMGKLEGLQGTKLKIMQKDNLLKKFQDNFSLVYKNKGNIVKKTCNLLTKEFILNIIKNYDLNIMISEEEFGRTMLCRILRKLMWYNNDYWFRLD